VEPGNLALPGAPLLTIEQAGAYRLEALVEESRSREMHTGRPTTVTLDSLGRTFTCRVSEIAPAIDAASRAFLVKIDLPPTEGLSSGLYGRARFTSTARQVLAIPAVALREQGQLRSVMVIDGNIARTRLITTGEKREEMVEVLSGLNPGERIASPAPLALADGGRVEVRQ
jgi:RND family efflux transporter MFP subunit